MKNLQQVRDVIKFDAATWHPHKFPNRRKIITFFSLRDKIFKYHLASLPNLTSIIRMPYQIPRNVNPEFKQALMGIQKGANNENALVYVIELSLYSTVHSNFHIWKLATGKREKREFRHNRKGNNSRLKKRKEKLRRSIIISCCWINREGSFGNWILITKLLNWTTASNLILIGNEVDFHLGLVDTDIAFWTKNIMFPLHKRWPSNIKTTQNDYFMTPNANKTLFCKISAFVK